MAYNSLRSNSQYLIDISNKDPWGIQEILNSGSSDIQSVLQYDPYSTSRSPFILTIEFSKGALYLLLKSGRVVKMALKTECPRQVIFPTKILDISCGLEHTLAKGRDARVYAWGNNAYGQLGLNIHDVSYKDDIEPTIVMKLTQWRMSQIYAIEYNSFCLSSDNTLFGFGNNEQGQIIDSKETKISTPMKIASFDWKEHNSKVMLNKQGNKLYYSQIHLPIKSFTKTIELRQNIRHSKEKYKLLSEVKQLKETLSNIMLNRSNAKSNECLTHKIEELIIKYEEKINKRQINYKTMSSDSDPCNRYDRLITLFQSQNNKLLQNKLINDLITLDYKLNPQLKLNTKIDLPNHQSLSKHSISLSSLLEKASSSIEIQKTKYIEHLQNQSKIQMTQLQKNKDFTYYLQLFKEVIELIKAKTKSFNNTDHQSETNSIKEQCSNEYNNFRMNTLEGITTANFNKPMRTEPLLTLNDYNNQSTTNLKNLSEKMNNLAINTTNTNTIGKKILNIFNKNIILLHQNNYLTHFILNDVVTHAYDSSVEKAFKYYNPSNYNALSNRIEEFKKVYEERNELKIRKQIKSNLLNGYNHRVLIPNEEEYTHNSELYSEDELN